MLTLRFTPRAIIDAKLFPNIIDNDDDDVARRAAMRAPERLSFFFSPVFFLRFSRPP